MINFCEFPLLVFELFQSLEEIEMCFQEGRLPSLFTYFQVKTRKLRTLKPFEVSTKIIHLKDFPIS